MYILIIKGARPRTEDHARPGPGGAARTRLQPDHRGRLQAGLYVCMMCVYIYIYIYIYIYV